MKKIKISELPLYQSLKGLFVMGTDVNNRSVKVNLEFIESVPRLTLGNANPVYLKAVLSPDTALKNLIYISDNRAVEVGLDGRISILNKGVSRVHIIPTCNTALARTVLIEVGEPTLRLVTTRRQMRFTQSGALRMN